MGFIQNFKYLNNREGIASTWGTVGADYIKSLESQLVACELDADKHHKKADATSDKSEALQATGLTFYDDVIVDLQSIIFDEKYKLYVSRVSYFYAYRILEKLDLLTNATLEGLAYREARKRFKEFKGEINTILQYDNTVGIYIDAMNKIGYGYYITNRGDFNYDELEDDAFQDIKDEILVLTKKSSENNNISYKASDLDLIMRTYPLVNFIKSDEYYSNLIPTLANE